MKSILLVIFAALALLPALAAAKGFWYSCYKIGLEEGHWLKGKCYGTDGKAHSTSLDLGRCFSNYDGYLWRVDDGAYHKSCRDCEYEESGILVCKCLNYKWEWHRDGLDLDEFIANWDGILCCGPNCGSKDSRTTSDEEDGSDDTEGVPPEPNMTATTLPDLVEGPSNTATTDLSTMPTEVAEELENGPNVKIKD